MAREKGWNLLCKFFDNMGPIPHHLHQSDEHAARVGRRGKPEAYYFPPQYNPTDNNYPYTFMGLEPGTTKDDVRRCLENWNKGDNGIMYLSRAYRLERGTGWQIDPGILHAPGSLLTYEPQVNSDVFAMFQSEVEGRHHAVGTARQGRAAGAGSSDLDYIIGMLDWDANVNPRFGESNRYFPKPVTAVRRDRTRRLPRAVGDVRHDVVLGQGAHGAAEADRHHQGCRRLRPHPHAGLRHCSARCRSRRRR